MRSLRLIPFTKVGAAAAATAATTLLKPTTTTTSSFPLPSSAAVALAPCFSHSSSSSSSSLLQSRRYLFGFSSSSAATTAKSTAATPEAQAVATTAAAAAEEEAKEYKKNKDGLMPEPAPEEAEGKVNKEKFVDVFLYDTINDYVNGKISSPKFVIYVMKTTLRAIKKNLEAELEQYKRDTEKIIAALQDEVERLRQRVRDLEARNHRLEKAAEEKELGK